MFVIFRTSTGSFDALRGRYFPGGPTPPEGMDADMMFKVGGGDVDDDGDVDVGDDGDVDVGDDGDVDGSTPPEGMDADMMFKVSPYLHDVQASCFD